MYCGEKKIVHTYLFDVNKWTMAEAQTWVKANKGLDESIHKYLTKGVIPEKEEHKEVITSILEGKIEKIIEKTINQEESEKKEVKDFTYKKRWNKSLSKLFDVERVESQPATFNYAILEKHFIKPVCC